MRMGVTISRVRSTEKAFRLRIVYKCETDAQYGHLFLYIQESVINRCLYRNRYLANI